MGVKCLQMSKPVRYQHQGCLHFITFSCFRRMQLLDTVRARETFEEDLERVRRWYGVYVIGYVVMPEHVHLLVSEPERKDLSVALQMLKQITSRKLRTPGLPRFWQVRYYDFPVWTEKKSVEKLRYIHRNPVKRGLVLQPQDWKWSSFVHHATGIEGTVEIESRWTAARRERMGSELALNRSHPSPETGERVGQPSNCWRRRQGSVIPPLRQKQGARMGHGISGNYAKIMQAGEPAAP